MTLADDTRVVGLMRDEPDDRRRQEPRTQAEPEPHRDLVELREARRAFVARRIKDIADAEVRQVLAKDPAAIRHGFRPAKTRLDTDEITVDLPRVKLSDGSVEMPRIYWVLKAEEKALKRRVRGTRVSTRDVRTVSTLVTTDGKPLEGTSSTRVAEQRKEDRGERLDELDNRRFGNEDVVAVMMDGTAVGRHTMVVAIGFTADGRKITLGVQEGSSESAEVCTRLVEDVMRRGVDKRVLWITDGGAAQLATIDKVSGAHKPVIQRCTWHKWKNIEEALDVDLRRVVEAAWTTIWVPEATAEQVAEGLESLAADLELAGQRGAAKLVRADVDELLTVRRLGVTGDALVTLEGTNPLESTFGTAKNRRGAFSLKNVSRWRDPSDPTYEDQRRRWMADALLELEKGWSQVENTDALKAVRDQLRPDPALDASIARPPELVDVGKLSVVTSVASAARTGAEDWLKQDRRGPARWFGAGAALKTFGIEGDPAVDAAALESVLRGEHVDSSAPIRRPVVDKEKVGRVAHLTARISASPALSAIWHEADGGERDRIEEALLAGGGAALDRIAHANGPSEGIAGVAQLRVEYEGSNHTRPRLYADVIVIGTERGGKILSPASGQYFKHMTVVGATVFHTVDVLAGITMAQVIRPGAPVLFGGAPATFHMKLASSPMAAIEALSSMSAYVEVAKRLGLPCQSYMALSDAKILDAQAGAETFGVRCLPRWPA